ncbi:NAD(P)H-dependent oxidoreductase [Actinomycetaceae bacterium TAE3-ERU4]|nr:NAD(P)H-dependent oxidoreductase [Actinomycetaceae bacterium TAE3-ERU4]
MKLLVVLGHPDAESFISACAYEYVSVARKKGHQVRFMDLSSVDFDPVLRFGYRRRMELDSFIIRSQEALVWAEEIVFFFPTWWAREPSVLAGWVERVFTPGLAYSFLPGRIRPQKLLSGKSAVLVTASHAPSLFSLLHPAYPLRRLATHVLGYCGIKVRKKLVLGGMDSSRDCLERRQEFIQKIRALPVSLEN